MPLTDNSAKVRSAIEKAKKQALSDAAEKLLGASNRTVPIDETDLQSSGGTTVRGDEAAVHYDTEYAVIQHERTDYEHAAGRRAKYLESAAKEESRAIGEVMAKAFRSALR